MKDNSMLDDDDRTVLNNGLHRVLGRIEDTRTSIGDAFPHWADPATGEWTTTPDGDWTGGSWPGQLWLAARISGDPAWADAAALWERRMRPRLARRTAFKGYGFFHAAVMGWCLNGDQQCRADALQCAHDLAAMYDSALGLIPLGVDAEEGSNIGAAESSIDSLQASPLLLWAANETGDAAMENVAVNHTTRVLDLHVRRDSSVIQSTTLNSSDGTVIRHHTHKGYSDDSTWARAQSWAVLYASQCYAMRPQQSTWLTRARQVSDWWIGKVPQDKVSYWDFDDPAIPATERDTAATTISSAGMLKLSEALAASDPAAAQQYRSFATDTIKSVVAHHVTPTRPGDRRPTGMLVDGCFTKRADARAHDLVTSAELIFGTYFLTECLAVLLGHVQPSELGHRRAKENPDAR
jgi:unsaturated chondroitin disaccharide hydrolase